jgi:hypothetical protein
MQGDNTQDWYCLQDENIISLKTALFQDTGYVAWMLFLPEQEDFGRKEPGYCCLFRRHISEENVGLIEKLLGKNFSLWTQLEDFDVPFPPRVEFLWSENGQSVAAVVEGQAIGFIAEGQQRGYSRSIRKWSGLANAWDEKLFRELFG